ncbi:unnamed protein product [Ascophyllum nodosum]
MAHLTRRLAGTGLESFKPIRPLLAGRTLSGSGVCRSMSTSLFARATGSMLGKYSVKVKKGNVVEALDKIQERERLMRLDEMMAREAFYEKGFKKRIRKRKFNEWRNQYKAVMSQAKWITLLRMKGVPVPGEKRRDL